jgi:hypothetical protein
VAKNNSKGPRLDEFAFVLLGGIILMAVFMLTWTSTPPEIAPIVYPAEVELTIPKGSIGNFSFVVRGNLSRIDIYAAGDIKKWLNFDQRFFSLGGEQKVNVYVQVPKSAASGRYKGTIIIYPPLADENKTVDVEVEVVEESEEKTRTISFGDFVVSYDVGQEDLVTKSNFKIAKGMSTDTHVNMVHESISDSKLSMLTSASIYLLVEDTNREGNLIVEFNGVEIFNRLVGIGEVIIPLNKSQIKNSNTITIKTESPGWKFWTDTEYYIKLARLRINYEGSFFKTFEFPVTSQEVNNFEYGVLEFVVRSPPMPNDLVIKINNKQLFKGKPPVYFETQFTDMDLIAGLNNISFTTDRQALYDLKDVRLTVFYREQFKFE